MKVLIGAVISRKTGEEMPIYEDFPEEKAKRIEEYRMNALVDILKDYIFPLIENRKNENGGVL